MDETDSRANQKSRTRRAIVDAGLALVDEGVLPRVVDAAERAKGRLLAPGSRFRLADADR